MTTKATVLQLFSYRETLKSGCWGYPRKWLKKCYGLLELVGRGMGERKEWGMGGVKKKKKEELWSGVVPVPGFGFPKMWSS